MMSAQNSSGMSRSRHFRSPCGRSAQAARACWARAGNYCSSLATPVECQRASRCPGSRSWTPLMECSQSHTASHRSRLSSSLQFSAQEEPRRRCGSLGPVMWSPSVQWSHLECCGHNQRQWVWWAGRRHCHKARTRKCRSASNLGSGYFGSSQFFSPIIHQILSIDCIKIGKGIFYLFKFINSSGGRSAKNKVWVTFCEKITVRQIFSFDADFYHRLSVSHYVACPTWNCWCWLYSRILIKI